MFSEESELLAKHWDVVEDIKTAESRLNEELAKFFVDFEDVIKKQDWWTDKWLFDGEDSNQIDISHENWKMQGEEIIWIGVDGLKANHLFGTESSPEMYVWVDNKFVKKLCGPLTEIISIGDVSLGGELDQRPNGYIARKSISKILPEDVDDFSKLILDSLLTFFGHYASYEEQFTEAVKKL